MLFFANLLAAVSPESRANISERTFFLHALLLPEALVPGEAKNAKIASDGASAQEKGALELFVVLYLGYLSYTILKRSTAGNLYAAGILAATIAASYFTFATSDWVLGWLLGNPILRVSMSVLISLSAYFGLSIFLRGQYVVGLIPEMRKSVPFDHPLLSIFLIFPKKG